MLTGAPSLNPAATMVLAAVASVGSGLAALLVAWTGIRQARSRIKEMVFRTKEVVRERSVEERLDELSRSMQESAQVVTQISAELEARAMAAKQLQEDAKAAEALAGMHKEQAEAIRRLMDAEFAASERRIRRDSLIVGIGSFIAGGGVSYLLTLLH
jgi:hypothetical protein